MMVAWLGTRLPEYYQKSRNLSNARHRCQRSAGAPFSLATGRPIGTDERASRPRTTPTHAVFRLLRPTPGSQSS